LRVIRPADANEVAQAWRIHFDGEGPTAIILTRQKIPVLEGTAERGAAGVAAGAYTLVDEQGDLGLVLVACGSEVSLCVDAQEVLAKEGIATRVVSMPSWDLFEQQPEDARASVLPPGLPTLAVEAASPFGWERYADDVIGIDTFGTSAPGAVALEHFGFTVDNVVERARALLGH